MTHHCMKTQRYNYKNDQIYSSLVCSQNGSCIAKQLFALDIHTKDCMSKKLLRSSSGLHIKSCVSKRKQINFMMIVIDHHTFKFLMIKWPQVIATTSLSRFHLAFFTLAFAVSLLLTFLFLDSSLESSLLSKSVLSMGSSSSGTSMQSWSCVKTS